MKILNYIKHHSNTWQEDFKKLHINIKTEGEYTLFKYDIDADFSNPLVREARGCILKNLNTIVCYPFNKFGNYGESYADKINWKTAKVQEKIDGSIIKLWYDNDVWHISTNNVINAYTAPLNNSNKTYGQLFDEAILDVGLDYTMLDTNYTYIFELVSPENRVVINYPKTTIYHIGTRDNRTEKEVNMDIGVAKPKTYKLSSLEECIDAVQMMNTNTTLDNIQNEGYVVVDKYYNRIKIKSKDYVQAAYFKGLMSLSDEKTLEIIKNGETEEICTYFPIFKDKINDINKKIHCLKVDMCIYCMKLERNLSRKDFALKHKQDKFFDLGIKYIYENTNIITLDFVDDYVDKLTTKKLISLL